MSNGRIFNFSAGPSMLPEEVLEKAASELTNYRSSGMSVMEMSHRSKVYEEILHGAEGLVHEVLSIPEDYKVLFLQGGAMGQFAAVPLNLASEGDTADYIITGQFAGKAADEAKKYLNMHVAATTKSENFTRIPRQNELSLTPGAAYVHLCYNNTIFGTKWDYIPETNGVPLVADISSYIASEPFDASRFGLLYAGAQKNLGPAGVTLVAIRKDLLGRTRAACPSVFDYAVMAENDSMLNTPPTYGIYMLGLVLEWVRAQGGLAAMKKQNEEKAALLYDFLDGSRLFSNPVDKINRSMMNVVFVTGDKELDDLFCKEAGKAGFENIKGHRSVGGMRASIYNAMPREGLEKLVAFMAAFEKEHQK